LYVCGWYGCWAVVCVLCGLLGVGWFSGCLAVVCVLCVCLGVVWWYAVL
jgi:hypothetical protein